MLCYSYIFIATLPHLGHKKRVRPHASWLDVVIRAEIVRKRDAQGALLARKGSAPSNARWINRMEGGGLFPEEGLQSGVILVQIGSAKRRAPARHTETKWGAETRGLQLRVN